MTGQQANRRFRALVMIPAAVMFFAGCASEVGQGAGGGAALGAIAGALVGGKRGAAIGAAAGAALGAATGAYLKQRREQYATLEQMAHEEIRIADQRNMQLAMENTDLRAQIDSIDADINSRKTEVESTAAQKQSLASKANALKSELNDLDRLIEQTEEDIKNQQTIVEHLRRNEKLAEAERLEALLAQQRDVELARLRQTRADAAQTLTDVQRYV